MACLRMHHHRAQAPCSQAHVPDALQDDALQPRVAVFTMRVPCSNGRAMLLTRPRSPLEQYFEACEKDQPDRWLACLHLEQREKATTQKPGPFDVCSWCVCASELLQPSVPPWGNTDRSLFHDPGCGHQCRALSPRGQPRTRLTGVPPLCRAAGSSAATAFPSTWSSTASRGRSGSRAFG
jgi:hypothetical protein